MERPRRFRAATGKNIAGQDGYGLRALQLVLLLMVLGRRLKLVDMGLLLLVLDRTSLELLVHGRRRLVKVAVADAKRHGRLAADGADAVADGCQGRHGRHRGYSLHGLHRAHLWERKDRGLLLMALLVMVLVLLSKRRATTAAASIHGDELVRRDGLGGPSCK